MEQWNKVLYKNPQKLPPAKILYAAKLLFFINPYLKYRVKSFSMKNDKKLKDFQIARGQAVSRTATPPG